MKRYFAAGLVIFSLTACVTTGTYTDKWTPITKSQSKISFAGVENLDRCIKVDAMADSASYIEVHLCKTGTDWFEAYYEVLRSGYGYPGMNTEDDFKRILALILKPEKYTVYYGPIQDTQTSMGKMYYAEANINDRDCFAFAGSYGVIRTTLGKGVTSRLSGVYCGPKEVVGRIDIDAYTKAVNIRSTYYNGEGVPVTKTEDAPSSPQ